MDKHLTDESKAFRRERIVKIKPRMGFDGMPLSQFYREYMRPFVVPYANLARWEEKQQVMACPACIESYSVGMLKVWKLQALSEDDPLGNFAMLVTVRCHHCKFEEIIPVDHPTSKVDPSALAAAKRALYDPNSWSSAMLDDFKMSEQRFAAFDSVWRQVLEAEHRAQEAQMYEQVMKSQLMQSAVAAAAAPKVAPPPPPSLTVPKGVATPYPSMKDDMLDSLNYSYNEAMRQGDTSLAEKIYTHARKIMGRKQ